MIPNRPDEISEFLANPSESLGVEMKQWIDPLTDRGKAKIAKACMALRNNNGGILIVGFRNDGLPDVGNELADVRARFHADVIQEIATKYSSEPFEVSVSFVEHDGTEYPVLEIPSGVRTPVACKADLPGNRSLLKTDTVYVRTLQSNNTVSSSAARWKDWERITQHCFDNREADIGSFIRRHLSGLDMETVGSLLTTAGSQFALKTPIDKAVEFLVGGYSRFQHQVATRNVDIPERLGMRETSILIESDFTPPALSQELLWRLESSAPRQTGWPPWVVLTGGAEEDMQPYVLDEGWEAMIAGQAIGPHLDFWRIEPRGRFYHIRALQDDMPYGDRSPQPYTTLDFLLQISRTAEVVSTGLSFARTLGCRAEETSLAVAMRWRNLEGRDLSCWVEPQRCFRSRGKSHQNDITTFAAIPLDTPLTALAPHVEKLVAQVFALFDGMKFESNVIEGIVQRTVERRL